MVVVGSTSGSWEGLSQWDFISFSFSVLCQTTGIHFGLCPYPPTQLPKRVSVFSFEMSTYRLVLLFEILFQGVEK